MPLQYECFSTLSLKDYREYQLTSSLQQKEM
jgi:hypothetical protein